MIAHFWRQTATNVIAIVVPMVATVGGMAILSRVSDSATVGIVMWTWFLLGVASALNAGLHPSMTNDFGQAEVGSETWRHMIARYVSASNLIYLAISLATMGWVVWRRQSDSDITYSIVLIQLVLVWMTGIGSLVMTGLNFSGHTELTAKSKLVFNTLTIVLPVLMIWAKVSVPIALGTLLLTKLFQNVILFRQATHLIDQNFSTLMHAPFGYKTLYLLLRRQWRMVLISLSQISFSFVDRLIVMTMFGISAYKMYGGVLDVLGMIWILASVFIIILHPKFASIGISFQEKRWLARYYTKRLFSVGAIGLLIVWFMLTPFLKIILNIELTPELSIICRNFLLGFTLSLSYILYNTLFIASSRQNAVLVISLMSLVLYGSLALPIVDQWGLVGLSYLFLFKFIFEAICYFSCLYWEARRIRAQI